MLQILQKKLSKKLFTLSFLLIAILVSVFFITKQINLRSNASSVTQLEAENGIFSPDGVSLLTDSLSSGGKAIQFASPPPIIYPSDSGMVNVKDYGVIGDGVTDDTQALLTLMHNTRNVSQTRMLYFPPGSYVVSNTLDWKDASGQYWPYLSFYGAGKDKTILKLKDNTPGFGDKSAPKAVIFTTTSCNQNYPDTCLTGNGNEAYRVNIENMTINTGKGNPGAMAISWLGNNRGYLLNLLVTSDDTQGVRGLDLTRNYGGPALIKNVTVNGFDTGIAVSAYSQSLTFEYITLNNQKVYGLTNDRQPIFIRKLTSNNQVPAIHVNQLNNSSSFITLIDSTLNGYGAASTQYAMEFLDGHAFVRNITTSGYLKAIKQRSTKTGVITYVDGPNITEYETTAPFTLFANSSTTSLNLPIKETPDIFYTSDMTQWANVVSFGAVPNAASLNFDSGPAIQRAIDSGKPIVYIPEGRYYVGDTIYIRGNVKAMYGFEAEINPLYTAPKFQNATNPRAIFSYSGGTSGMVGLERIRVADQYALIGKNPGLIGLEHTNDKNLVLKDVYLGGEYTSYRTQGGTGDLFIENTQIGTLWVLSSQNVWARQLNPEAQSPDATLSARVVNTGGGKTWIMGIKTEDHGTIIDSENNSYTEVIGGAYYPHANLVQPGEIVVINKNSHVSSNFAALINSLPPGYDIMVQETQGGVTKILDKTMVPADGQGSAVPLYVGNPSP